MNTTLIDSLNPAQLSQLLDTDDPRWDEQDTASVLRHQLHAPLLEDLQLVPSIASEICWLKDQMLQRISPVGPTFLDELTAPVPLIGVIMAIKAFARAIRQQPANPVHGTPATVLYFASVAVALTRCGTSISQLSDQELREGFIWAGKQGGAEALTGIFRAALAQLDAAASTKSGT